MNIRSTKNGHYQARVTIDGKQFCRSFDHKPTKREQEDFLIDCRTKQSGSDQRLSDAIEEYIKSKSNVLSPSTIRGYEKDARMLSDGFLDKQLRNIDQLAIQKEINRLAEKHSPHTVRNVHGLVSAVLRQFNPSMVINTTLPRKCKEEPYIPSDDEVKKVLEYLEDTDVYIPIALACFGLRRSEIFALTVEDFGNSSVTINKARVRDSDNKWITKPMTKTEASHRTVPIPPDLVNLIRSKGIVYQGSENALNRALHHAQMDLNIPSFSFHKLRHWFCSRALTMTDTATTMALGGWQSDHVMKSVYRHSLEEKERKQSIMNDLGSRIL